jgi:septum formation inhibitor MinC
VTTEPAIIPELLETEAHAARIERQDDTSVLALHPAASFEDVRDTVRELLSEHGPHADLRGQALRIDLGARALVLFDLRRLVNVLREEFEIVVPGLFVSPDALHIYAEKQLKMRVVVREPASVVDEVLDEAPQAEEDEGELQAAPEEALEEAPEADAAGAAAQPDAADTDDAASDGDSPEGEASDGDATEAVAAVPPVDGPITEDATEQAIPPVTLVPALPDAPAALPTPVPSMPAPAASLPEGGRRTLSVHRSLRSGTHVSFPGDLVIFGDVNPGAEVVADGSIVVLGTMRGLAHAGAHGDEAATVLALSLRPANLRIGTRQATLPFENENSRPIGLLERLRPERAAPRGTTPEVARVVDGQIVVEDYAGRPSVR